MGSAARLTIANGSSLLVNGIIPWATNYSDLASYVAPTAGNDTGGVGLLNSAGYQGYDASVIPAGAGSATQNLRLTAATFTVPDQSAGTYAANAIAFLRTVNGQNLAFANNADTLNLTAGTLVLGGAFTSSVGSAVGNGFLTSGGTGAGVNPLYLFVNSGATAINSSIVNNGVGQTRLVYTPATTAVTTLFGANTYSGGTQLNLSLIHI